MVLAGKALRILAFAKSFSDRKTLGKATIARLVGGITFEIFKIHGTIVVLSD